MKLKKQKRNPYDQILEFFAPVERNINFIYLFVMLGVFPLYVKDQYNGIGDSKFELFFQSTKIFLPVLTLLLLIKAIFFWKREREEKKNQMEHGKAWKEKAGSGKEQWKNGFLDIAVFSYGFLVLLSYFLSDYKSYALYGADGWRMGLLSQLMFLGIYFALSMTGQNYTSLLLLHLGASGLVFFFGILHRFQIDPLGMYEGLTLQQMTEFLSTIGQATWYSSYICTVFPLGLVCLYLVKKKWLKILCRVYSVITFGILVTQNSDSAFVALAGIMILLSLYSCKKKENWLVFLEIMMLLWGSFTVIGILQRIFSQRAVPLGSLSTFFSQSFFSPTVLLVSILFYLAYQKTGEKREDAVMKVTAKAVKVGSILAAVLTAALILLIYLNTKGYLQQWFGIALNHNYLLFDEYWGNNRGLSWMLAWKEYGNLPLYQKLFGVGPDAFSEYLYSIPEVQEMLQHKWGSFRLTNAHNEYLNSFICYGAIGLLAWLTVLIGGIFHFYRKAAGTEQYGPVLLGVALCIMGYFCHNIFCYQQVCCTPFLFIILGIGESYCNHIS